MAELFAWQSSEIAMLNRRLLLFGFVLFFHQAFGQSSYFRVIDKKSDGLILEWHAPLLTWQAITLGNETLVRPDMGSLPLSQEQGRPGLPMDAFVTEIPNGYEAEIQLLDSLVTESLLSYPLAPGFSTTDDTSLTKEGHVAQGDSYYPSSFVMCEIGKQRGRNRLRVGVTPLSYQPAGRRVRCLTFARLQIAWKPLPLARAQSSKSLSWKPVAGQAAKIMLTEEGVYEISAASLQQVGVDIASIVPADLKLYYQGTEQPLEVSHHLTDRLSLEDRIRFFAERRTGQDGYYNAFSDSNVYWLSWSASAGKRFVPVTADTASLLQDYLPHLLHLEQDLTYYSGDTELDIHDTRTVPGEGWAWSVINRGDAFSLTFNLIHLYEGQDSIQVRLRLRGTTLDPHTPDHHVQILLNQKKVYEFYFNDREEVLPGFKVSSSDLKPSENALEIRSLSDTEAERSQFYLDWVEFGFQQRTSGVNGQYILNGAELNPQRALFVDGFSHPAITIWDLDNARVIDPNRIGSFYRAVLQVRSAGLADGNHALFYFNGVELFRGGRGHNVVTLDGITGRLLSAQNFDTYGSTAQSDSMAALLNRLAPRIIVMVAVADEGSIGLTTAAKQALQRLGGAQGGALKYRSSYALIAHVAEPEQAVEVLSEAGKGPALATQTITLPALGNRYSAEFSLPYQPSGKMVVFDSSAVKAPSRLLAYHGADLADSHWGADYIIITHPSFQSAAQRIAEYRQRKNGFRTQTVLVDEIYDAFNYGLADPQAIKSFLEHAYHHWVKPAPSFVLLLGDASWDPKYHSGKLGQNDYVPSYGNPVSDLWFVCLDGADDVLPEMSIGRWPVETPAQAEALLQKMIEYESTPSGAWKKEFLFISGGFDHLEQSSFRGQSNALYNEFVLPPPMSGHADMIQKTSLDYREGENRNEILASINSGKAWINFIGHAASRTWDLMFHNADIDLLNNGPRYPFITSMTCHTGRFAQPDQESFGENFVLAEGKGAIAFLGTSGWGFSYEDYLFLRKLFPRVAVDSLRVLGQIVDGAKTELWATFGGSRHIHDMLLQYNILGDPATRLAIPLQPDLAITPEDIQVQPEAPSEADSTALVKVRLHNYGLATKDSVQVTIDAEHATLGRTPLHAIRRPPLGLVDSVTFSWPLHGMTGVVELQVALDGINNIDEADESNNQQVRRVTVLSSDIVLIAPPPDAMTPFDHAVVKIQNPQRQQAGPSTFYFQLDTTASFNSPALRRSGLVTSTLPMTVWSPGPLAKDQTYYWSVRNAHSSDSSHALSGRFFSSGDGGSGWRQDLRHHDESRITQNLQVSDAGLQLTFRSLPLLVQSAGLPVGRYAIIDREGESLMDTGRGYNVVVLDRQNGRTLATRRFDTYGDGDAANAMAEFIESLSSRHLVLIAISDDGGMNNERAFRAFESLGSSQCRSIRFRDSWAFIGFKGATREQVVEQYMAAATREAVAMDTLQLFKEQGRLQSAAIGPAKRWDLFSMDAVVPDSTWLRITIWGKNKQSGNVDTLLRAQSLNDPLDLSMIPADRYPRLFFQAGFGTVDGHLSPTLRTWQVHFQPPADLAVGPTWLIQSCDSVLVSGTVFLGLQVYNIGLQPADSVSVWFQEYDPALGYRTFASAVRTTPLPADSFWLVQSSWQALGKTGLRSLLISVDPHDDIPEVIENNNSVTTTVLVKPDTAKPKILVFFDDREIISGDLVSAAPVIEISVFDNSPITLQDSTRITVYLDGKRISYQDHAAALQWQWPSGGASAKLEYKPLLEDGDHSLEVQVTDPSGNRQSRREEFTVESELKLLRVMNYPNPLTEETEITFDLTQPAHVSVQIFTVTGRLLRELENDIRAAGFSAVHWDGRDADGDRLANGVYLYKVSARSNDKRIEEIGKAVILR